MATAAASHDDSSSAVMETAFHFLGEEQEASPRPSPQRPRKDPAAASASASAAPASRARSNSHAISEAAVMTFDKFAERYFQDKRRNNAKYHRGPLPGPLLKQIWGDGDSERVLSVWVTILRFLGDLPPKQSNPLSNLQMVQLVQNIAIARPNTRDEIYCQVCKQLTDNPNQASHARGWILMALLCGVVAPSERFLAVLEEFIRSGPPAYAPFVLKRLQRTVELGTRKQPSCSLEMHAAFTRQPIELVVDFYLDSCSVKVHPQTTAADIIATVRRKRESLKPQYGFSIFVGDPSGELLSSAGSTNTRLMDKIYSFEQLSEEANGDWRTLCAMRPFVIMYRKEAFAPWPEGHSNLSLLYAQIVSGMRNGLYRCREKDALALLLAQLYYVEHGHILDADQLLDMLTEQPVAGMESMSFDDWTLAVKQAFDANDYHSKPCTKADLKVEVVEYARQNWHLEFSKNYSDCTVAVDGRVHSGVVAAVNCKGLFVVDSSKTTTRAGGRTSVIVSVPYVEFVELTPCVENPANPDWQEFTLTSVQSSMSLTITGPEVESLHRELEHNYQGLCKRSKYAIAMLPYKSPSATSAFLSFEKGDLIVLPKPMADSDQNGWCNGICERTKKLGEFPSANVYIVPTVTRPSPEVLEQYSEYCKALTLD